MSDQLELNESQDQISYISSTSQKTIKQFEDEIDDDANADIPDEEDYTIG